MTTLFKNYNVGVWILVELAPELYPGCPMFPNWNSRMLLGITIPINKENDANGKQLSSKLQAGPVSGSLPFAHSPEAPFHISQSLSVPPSSLCLAFQSLFDVEARIKSHQPTAFFFV